MTSTFEGPHSAVVSLLPILRTEAGVRTVLYRDVPFAVVQAETAREAHEQAKRLLFCSCLNALDERQIAVRDAEDEEFERWAKFRRDHVFECPTSLLGIPPLVPPTRRGERRRRSRRFLRQLAVFGAVLLLPILAAAGGIYAGLTVPEDKYAGAVPGTSTTGFAAVGQGSQQAADGAAGTGAGTRGGARRPSTSTPLENAAAGMAERFTNQQFAAAGGTFGLERQPMLAQRAGGGTENSGGSGEGAGPSVDASPGGTSRDGDSAGDAAPSSPSVVQMASSSFAVASTSPVNGEGDPGSATVPSIGTPGTTGNPPPARPTTRTATPGPQGTDTPPGETTTPPQTTTPGTDEPGTSPPTTTETPPPEDTTLPDETTPTNGPGDQTTVVAVPEPGSLALFGVSLAALALLRRRRAQSPR